jgi:hypothetical protein
VIFCIFVVLIIFTFLVVAVCAAVLTMLVLVEIYDQRALDPLGFVSMTLNIINFGAPLAGLVSQKISIQNLIMTFLLASSSQKALSRNSSSCTLCCKPSRFKSMVPLWSFGV